LKCNQKGRFFGSQQQQLTRSLMNQPIHQQLANLHTHAMHCHHQAPKTLGRFTRLH
jgi:hypothetical protein